MGTIEDKLRYLAKTKKDIMNALKSKGVEINESTPFSEYDVMIKSIQGGGDVLLCKNMEELEEKGELSSGTLVMIYDEETDTFGGIYEATENGLQVLPTQLTADATNVAPGIKAFGPDGVVEGTFTSDATATATDIIAPKTAYVNGKKITGNIIKNYESISSDSPTTVVYSSNTEGRYCLDYNSKYNVGFLASSMGASEFVLGTLDIESQSLCADITHTFNVTDFNRANTATIQDISIAVNPGEDGLLNVGILMFEDSKTYLIIAKFNITTKQFVKYYSTSWNSNYGSGYDALTTKMINLEVNPINPNYFAIGITGWLPAAICTDNFIAKLENGTISITSKVRTPTSPHGGTRLISCIHWSVDGKHVLTTGSGFSYLFELDYTNFNFTYIGVISSTCCFYKGAYILAITGEVYSIADINTVAYTLSAAIGSGSAKVAIKCLSDDYVYVSSSMGTKLYYINPTTNKVNEFYTYSEIPYISDRGINNINTIYYPRVIDNTLCVRAHNVTGITYLSSCNTVEVLNSLNYSTTTFYNTSGNTVSTSEILTGKTAHSANGLITGTMPNIGARIITPGENQIAIPKGYHNGNGYVKAVDITDLAYYNDCLSTSYEILGNWTPPLIPYTSGVNIYYSGNNLTDKSDNGNNGTLTASYSTGTDYIEFTGGYGTTAAINNSYGTFEMYCSVNSNFTPITPSDPYWYNYSTVFGCELGAEQKDFAVVITPSGYFAIGYAFDDIAITNIKANDGNAHHIVLITTSSNLKLYIDGILVKTVTYTMSGSAITKLRFILE